MAAKRRGRPPTPADQSLSTTFLVRLDPREKAAFRDAATVAGVPLSVWIRERLRWTATRELREAGKDVAFLVTSGGK